MNQENKDKTLSSIVVLITITLLVYLLLQSGIVDAQEGKTLKDLFSMLMAQYLDFVIISYAFLCFQLAGFIELKYKKDFMTVSILSILLTPISILFILQNEQNDE
tara:strand:+ start:2404 stop:2718 length:315 start_codon:yes stop_codon:yes gene_type:complete